MDTQSHILSSFNEDLAKLKDYLVEMVSKVESSFEGSMQGLQERDLPLCGNVIADDETIDTAERIIDNLAMNVLLRYNPVASDLRFVVSSISIAKDLERIGDQASQIAKQSRKLIKKDLMSPDVKYIEDLYALALTQFQFAKQAILTTDKTAAEECLAGEDNVRAITKKVSKIFIKMMSNEGDAVPTYLSLVMIARSIERVSKLSCNISENIIFIETAEDVRADT